MTDAKLRIAAVGDLHCTRDAGGTIAKALAPVNDLADVLLLCGDLTDYGTVEEAKALARELAVVRVPVVGVLGNHDFETGHEEDVTSILGDSGVRILDGGTFVHAHVGFAGIKGFCGGFGRGTLGHWGEPVLKRFVQEAIDEELKLETALARLHMFPTRVVVMHYAPVRATVIGEPEEIHPFLGSSRLEEPLGRTNVAAVFHGHAHRGTPEGKTHARGTPVYNVAWPLMMRTSSDRSAFRVVEIDVEPPEDEGSLVGVAH